MRLTQPNRPYIDATIQGKHLKSLLTALEEFIEQKVKVIAEEVVRKSHAELNSKLTQRTKQIRDYIDNQLTGQAPLSEEGGRRNSVSYGEQSASLGGLPQHLSAGPSNEDYKTKHLKRALQTEVSTALLAQRIQCKPIEGHDMPLLDL